MEKGRARQRQSLEPASKRVKSSMYLTESGAGRKQYESASVDTGTMERSMRYLAKPSTHE